MTRIAKKLGSIDERPVHDRPDARSGDRAYSAASRSAGRGGRVDGGSIAAGLCLIFALCSSSASAAERQITHAPQGHVLTNVNVWSPDGQWIVYDTRTRDDQFTGTTIERVRVATGEVEVLYEAKDHAKVGVVTTHPIEDRVIFIHGPERPTAEWSYGMTRRRGTWVDAGEPGVAKNLDAMTYGTRFAPGALRGGSHVHVYSPDGQAVSFTYDDEVLSRLGAEPSRLRDINQRNVGVAVPAGRVWVSPDHARNHDGEWFSVLVTRTENVPRPGSDDISRACEEGWIGTNGYLRIDGSRQLRALAFQGTVTARDGTMHSEVYVVDLPADLTVAGHLRLQGTATRRPAPPLGTEQRRVTFTDDRKHPGLATTPRHWLRSSPDGSAIAFLMKDDEGLVQLWTVSPNGGPPRQVTDNPREIASAFTWNPAGTAVAHVMDGSVCITYIATGQTHRLTPPPSDVADAPRPFACVFSPDGRSIAYTRSVEGAGGRFDQVFITTLPLLR